MQSLGITANSNNFASDFIYLDMQGREYHDDPRKLDNWYGSTESRSMRRVQELFLRPQMTFRTTGLKMTGPQRSGHPKLPAGKDPKDIGNFVLIDHQNGEYSLLVHMKPGSVIVKPDDRVRAA